MLMLSPNFTIKMKMSPKDCKGHLIMIVCNCIYSIPETLTFELQVYISNYKLNSPT